MSIIDLIKAGEGQNTEFKKSLSLKREALEALCAMVNADSAFGTIVFGVEPDGIICGVEPGNLDKAQRSIIQAIETGFQPNLNTELKMEESQGKQVIILNAKRSLDVPYHEYDGRAWIREGPRKRQLELDEKNHLRNVRDRNKHPGPWKCNECKRWIGVLISFEFVDGEKKKSYKCKCGGEYWPCT
jgi:ATP-dependent DNA helicase RecG